MTVHSKPATNIETPHPKDSIGTVLMWTRVQLHIVHSIIEEACTASCYKMAVSVAVFGMVSWIAEFFYL